MREGTALGGPGPVCYQRRLFPRPQAWGHLQIREGAGMCHLEADTALVSKNLPFPSLFSSPLVTVISKAFEAPHVSALLSWGLA